MLSLGIPGIGPGEVIGSGPRSTVFAATHDDGRRVVVKVLTAMPTSEARARFERGVEALSALDGCPGIAPLLGHGFTERGEPYLLRPAYPDSIQGLIDGGPVPWERATALIEQAASAVHQGHHRVGLHLGLTPANLLLDSDEVRVDDFGTARLVRDLGQPATLPSVYEAPEVIAGSPPSLESEVSSLATILVALLNGRTPYVDADEQISVATLNRIVDGPREIVHRPIPARLRAVIERARHRDPARRHPSAGHLAADLAAAREAGGPAVLAEMSSASAPASGRSTGSGGGGASSPESDPVTSPPDNSRPARAWPGRVARATLAVVLTASLVGGILWLRTSRDSASTPAPTPAPAATTEVTPAPTATATVAAVPGSGSDDPGPTVAPVGAAFQLAPPADAILVRPGDDLAEAVRDARDGAILALTAGEHTIDEIVFVNRPLTIRGDSPETTTLTVRGTAQAIAISGVPATVADLTITTDHTIDDDVDDGRFALVQLSDTPPETLVSNVVVSGGLGSGLTAFGTAQGTIADSQFVGNRWSGAALTESARMTLADNVALGNGQHGFVWTGDALGTAVANRSERNGFNGFSAEDSAQPAFVANEAEFNAEAGFGWRGSTSGRATANEATNNGFSGFTVADAAAPFLNANRSTANNESGFAFFDRAAGVARDNLASGNGLNGLAVFDNGAPLLVNNLLSGNLDDDFEVEEGTLATVNDAVVEVEPGDDLAAAVADAAPGTLVLLGPGVHEIDEFIRIDRDLTVRGASAATTTVAVTGHPQAFALDGATVNLIGFAVESRHRLSSGRDADRFALIQLDDTNDGTAIVNVEPRGGLGTGLSVFGSSRAVVAASQFVGNELSGVTLLDEADVVLARNIAELNKQSGFAWFGDATGVAAANIARSNELSGFAPGGRSTPLLIENESLSNQASGYAWFDDTAAAAIGNEAERNGDDGFTWFGDAGGEARENAALENEIDGFATYERSGPTLRGNRAGLNGRRPFNRSDDSAPTTAGNRFGG